MKKLLLAIACILFIPACMPTGAKGPRFADAPKPAPSDSLGTVYLAYIGGPEARMSFQVDGKALFSARPASYTWVQLPPGRHVFRAQVGFMDMDLAAPPDSTYNQAATATVDVAAGQTYYLEFSTEGEMTRTDEHFIYGVGIVGPQFTERGKSLTLVDPEVGLWNLQQLVYVPARGSRD